MATRGDFLKLATVLVACQLAGAIGSVSTVRPLETWYSDLHKPAFTPPGWVFGPVWVTLYVLMAVAAFLVWRKGLGGPRREDRAGPVRGSACPERPVVAGVLRASLAAGGAGGDSAALSGGGVCHRAFRPAFRCGRAAYDAIRPVVEFRRGP